MKNWMTIAMVLVVCGMASPQENHSGLPRLRVLSIHDGDTVTADVLFPFDVALMKQPIRLDGYDAWEIQRGRGGVTITEEELARGREARAALASLLSTSDYILALPGKGDRTFGRLVVRVLVVQDGTTIDVARWMEKQGHTRKE